MNFPSWNWPVRWDLPVSIARSDGQEPSVILADPNLAAHRMLDRLSSLAEQATRGGKTTREIFANSVQEILRLAPWLGDLAHEHKITAEDQHDSESADTAPDQPNPASQNLVDATGVALLLAVAATTSGKSGASLVLGLFLTALANERTMGG